MQKRSALWLLIGGGVTAVGAALFAVKKSSDTENAVRAAVNTPPSAPALPGAPARGLPTLAVHTTGYWPYQEGLSPTERKMEGGTNDRKRRPIYTLEMFQAGKAPYVSVAGDYTLWPDGQRISISAWPGVIFRVVDTGGHFFGLQKRYRVVGEEPLDIAVQSSKTFVPKKNVTASIHVGDTFGSKKGPTQIVAEKFKDQNVVLSGEEVRIAAAEALVDAYYDAMELP
jgi:hypothetical protein